MPGCNTALYSIVNTGPFKATDIVLSGSTALIASNQCVDQLTDFFFENFHFCQLFIDELVIF